MVERLDWRLIIKDPGDLPQHTVSALDTYFTRFAEPQWNGECKHPCLNCGAPACGFTFGIVTGCGHCKDCGWPARRDHALSFLTFGNVVLQYHPDFVTEERGPDPFTGFPYQLIPEHGVCAARVADLPGESSAEVGGSNPSRAINAKETVT